MVGVALVVIAMVATIVVVGALFVYEARVHEVSQNQGLRACR